MIVNNHDQFHSKIFEQLEIRSSGIFFQINELLTQLKEVDATGTEWRTICVDLKGTDDELDSMFEQMRFEIEAISGELKSKENMLKHLERTVETYLQS